MMCGSTAPQGPNRAQRRVQFPSERLEEQFDEWFSKRFDECVNKQFDEWFDEQFKKRLDERLPSMATKFPHTQLIYLPQLAPNNECSPDTDWPVSSELPETQADCNSWPLTATFPPYDVIPGSPLASDNGGLASIWTPTDAIDPMQSVTGSEQVVNNQQNQLFEGNKRSVYEEDAPWMEWI
jgi:hypothetical protein